MSYFYFKPNELFDQHSKRDTFYGVSGKGVQ